MTNRIWILGAPDHEMAAIEHLLRECGETVVHATVDGKRVHPGNMYQADSPAADLIWDNGVGTIYAIECAWAHRDGETGDVVTIDHHRPGDPGFGKPPEDFLAASSLGQVITELARLGALPSSWDGGSLAEYDTSERGSMHVRGGHPEQPHYPARWAVVTAALGETGGDWGADPGYAVDVPSNLVLTAAADHCLGAAYAGKCPGADPSKLLAFRAEQIAEHAGTTAATVLASIQETEDLFDSSPSVWQVEQERTGGESDLDEDLWTEVLDMRDRHYPQLPEAACYAGQAYLAVVGGEPDRDPRQKIVLGGNTTPEMVESFLRDLAPALGLTGVYGDPARGFAGGYLP